MMFSIIIVNFNGKNFLKNCIASILDNRYRDFEIIVVDNGSTDGSIDLIKKEYPTKTIKLKTISLKKNFGPARARNEGVKVAKGDILGFLDNDTMVDKNWIIEAKKCFEENINIGVIQCKIMLLNDKNKIDYVGEYLSSIGFVIPRAVHGEIDKGQYDVNEKILAAKSAGMFMRKNIFELVGGFDEDYFIFTEETDLGWRSWLAGRETIFCPGSIVYHHFSLTKDITSEKYYNYLVRFHGTKNYILTLIKNLSPVYLVTILPIHLFLWGCLSIFLLAKGNPLSFINIWKGIIWNIVNLKKTWNKRKRIQSFRKVGDGELFMQKKLMRKKPLMYFIKKYLGTGKVTLTVEV